MALMMPWTWCSGSTFRMRSSGVQPQASTRVVTWAWMLACVVTTPLGLPVDPLVYRTIAALSTATSGRACLTTESSSSSVVRTKRSPRASAIGLSLSANWGCATTMDASASSTVYSNSASGWDTANGTAMPPALQMPHCTATYSKPGGARKATRASPRSTPPSSSIDAARAETSRSALYEKSPVSSTTAVRSP